MTGKVREFCYRRPVGTLSTFFLYQPSHGTKRCDCSQLDYVDHFERLTGMKTDELVEVSQDHDPQSPD